MEPKPDASFPASLSRIDNQVFSSVKDFARELHFFQAGIEAQQSGLGWKDHEKLPITECRRRAGMESAVLQLQYPGLSVVKFFPSLYRFLRTQELCSRMDRGGDNLLVGSGTTLYEALAMAVKPPSLEEANEVLNGENLNSLPSVRRQIQEGLPIVKPGYLPHKITAIEPDTRQTAGFESANSRFGVLVDVKNQTLEEFLNSDSRKFGNVVMNRVDPRGFMHKPELLDALLGRVVDEGSLVVTIGTGNTREEFKEREDFLHFIKTRASNRGLTSMQEPRLYRGVDATYFGPDIKGGFMAKKI